MRRYGVCVLRVCGQRGVGSQGETTSAQSAAELLRKARATRGEAASRASTWRQARKTAFFTPTTAANAKDNEQDAAGKHQHEGSSGFMRRLADVRAKNETTMPRVMSEMAEARRSRIERKVKEERRRLLVFRDVGMDLDKPILSRDVFLLLKYVLYGSEFAVDNELERQLRYFREHATKELKIIQDSKLMRGPATLSRKGNTANKASGMTGGARPGPEVPFPVTSDFPTVRAANMRQFCPTIAPDTYRTLHSMLHLAPEQQTGTPFARFFASSASSATRYSVGDASLFTTLHASTFRRPAVIIFSQLGQEFGTQADLEWRTLVYRSICPPLLPYMNGSKKTAACSGETRLMPIDVLSLRSMDMYRYEWVQRIFVRRFAKALKPSQTRSSDAKAAQASAPLPVSGVYGALVASTTFVGSKLLQSFHEPFGLRNYLLPHVLLVDHCGAVRWISAGFPDAYEAAHMPALLAQLEKEYVQRR